MSFFVKEGGIFYDVTLYFYPISFNRSAKVPGNVLVDIFPNEFLEIHIVPYVVVGIRGEKVQLMYQQQ